MQILLLKFHRAADFQPNGELVSICNTDGLQMHLPCWKINRRIKELRRKGEEGETEIRMSINVKEKKWMGAKSRLTKFSLTVRCDSDGTRLAILQWFHVKRGIIPVEQKRKILYITVQMFRAGNWPIFTVVYYQ